MSLPLSLAWKYLTFRQKDKNISFMIRICFLSILIGTFALMLTLIITNGFEKVIHEKMQGITSQAIIHAPGNKIDGENIKKMLSAEFGDRIKAMSSSSTKQVIIEHNKQQSVLFIKGVEPETEGQVSTIGKKIVLPIIENKPLQTILSQEKTVLIGYKTAQTYNLSIGSNITLLIPEPTSKKRISLSKEKAVVGGIFKVGLEEYDSNFAYCSIDFMQQAFGKEKGVDQISLALDTKKEPFSVVRFAQSLFSISFWKNLVLSIFGMGVDREAQIVNTLRQRLFGLTVNSWKDLYPALVSSLKLEKYVMFLILLLITLVACMNMISLLFMQIQQKRRDIAIFKAMGMAHKQIKRIFLAIGLSVTFFASAVGLGLAAIAGHLLEKYPFIKIPDVYFVSYLPARMDPENFVVVFGCTILLGFFATWIPAYRTRKIHVVDVLRQE